MRTKTESATTPDMPPLTDLRAITRESKRCLTEVSIYLNFRAGVKWLIFGQAQIRSQRDRPDGRYYIDARMAGGATDFEHDSAYALRLPLIGLQFDSLLVYYHTTQLIAWVDPDAEDDFRVPTSSEYNPMRHKDAVRCKDRRCLSQEPKGHIIVPEGFWLPPFNANLYQMVQGKKVEIKIGPVRKDDEE